MEVQKNAHSLHALGCGPVFRQFRLAPKAKPLAGFAEPGANGRRANFLGTRAAAANRHGYGAFNVRSPKSLGGPSEGAFALRWDF
jgi:hypothetical protein